MNHNYQLKNVITKIRDCKKNSQKIVFTNGVFDILHVGHTRYLSEASTLGDILVIGINSDNSVKDSKDLYGLSKNKGEVKNKFTSTIRTSFIGPELNTKKSLLSCFLNEKHNIYHSGILCVFRKKNMMFTILGFS